MKPSVALLACQAGGETYCLPRESVLRLERDQGTHPVYRLAALLGAPLLPRSGGSGPVLLLDGPRGPWGLMVDRVERATEVAAADLLPLPPLVGRAAGPRLDRVARLPGGLALLLAPRRLYPEQTGGNGNVAGAATAAASAALGPTEAQSGASASGTGGEVLPLPAELEGSPQAEATQDAGEARGIGALASAPGAPRLLLFSTSPGGEAPVLFGLSLSQVQEIVRPQPLLRVPGAPPYLLGLAPFRDEVVPVIDLSLRMGAGPSFFEGESRLLIARGARVPLKVAFPVRPEIKVEGLPLPNRVNATGRLLDRSLVRGVFELDAGTVFIPDLDRFLTQA